MKHLNVKTKTKTFLKGNFSNSFDSSHPLARPAYLRGHDMRRGAPWTAHQPCVTGLTHGWTWTYSLWGNRADPCTRVLSIISGLINLGPCGQKYKQQRLRYPQLHFQKWGFFYEFDVSSLNWDNTDYIPMTYLNFFQTLASSRDTNNCSHKQSELQVENDRRVPLKQ